MELARTLLVAAAAVHTHAADMQAHSAWYSVLRLFRSVKRLSGVGGLWQDVMQGCMQPDCHAGLG
jgi:hypothetical protein